MGKQYKQLGLKERSEIQEGLDRGDSFRAIGRLIGRSASTVSREVRENRTVRSFKPRKAACREELVQARGRLRGLRARGRVLLRVRRPRLPRRVRRVRQAGLVR